MKDVKVILLMGVSGCGKSTVGAILAPQLGGVFLEGDDFHPPANKAKMGAGIALTDEDRWPWFAAIREAISAQEKSPVVVACSALKREYRRVLLEDMARPVLIYLRGEFDIINARIQNRKHEYMPASLLKSQFATLEEPGPEEDAIIVDVSASEEEIAARIAERLRRRGQM